MTASDFTYWPQGFVELQISDNPPSKQQWKLIKEHLGLVFNKITPPLEKPTDFPGGKKCSKYLDPNLIPYYSPPNKILERIKELQPSIELSICGPSILDSTLYGELISNEKPIEKPDFSQIPVSC